MRVSANIMRMGINGVLIMFMNRSLLISIPHPQPNSRLVRRGPINPMFLVRWDVDEIANLHLYHAILELQPRCSLQDDHPLMLRSVIPEVSG